MTDIQTVRGPVDIDQLGTTLMHEHVFVLTPDVMQNYGDQWWDEPTRVADAVIKLQELKRAGVDTIVDPTVVGLGRYIPRIQQINAEVDINIVQRLGAAGVDDARLSQVVHVDGVAITVATPAMLYEMKRDTVRPQDRADAAELGRRFGLTDGGG